MQNLRWQKKVSRKYCLVIHLLKILSPHPNFDNIVTSSIFWKYCHLIQLFAAALQFCLRQAPPLAIHNPALSLQISRWWPSSLEKTILHFASGHTIAQWIAHTQILSTGINACLKLGTFKLKRFKLWEHFYPAVHNVWEPCIQKLKCKNHVPMDFFGVILPMIFFGWKH